MKQKNLDFIKELIENGFSYSEIANAMCDGVYLKTISISESDAEEIYNYCVMKNI